jgi:hypothetical protein
MRIRDPVLGMETIRIQDSGSGMEKSQIQDGRDKHPGSATLLKCAALWQRSLDVA